MATKYCIIHSWCIDHFDRLNPNRTVREEADQALAVIEEIRRTCQNVVLLKNGWPPSVADKFERGDTAILCGAYRGACLAGAQRALEKKGVRVLYHPIASVPHAVTDVPFFDDKLSDR